jgi:hypothetical protein
VGVVPKGFNHGPLVIWAHPAGKASVFEADGRTPVKAARTLLHRGVAILAPDVFLTGEFHLAGAPTELVGVKNEGTFPGYRDGYNPTVLAQRTRDLVTTISFARTTLKPSAIHLVAVGRAGVWGLLARALVGEAITRASIDLVDGFDFDRVHSSRDEMMLPGALKYGGINGFLSLCTFGETEVYEPPPGRARTPLTPSVTLRRGAGVLDTMTRWVTATAPSSR